MNENPNKPAAAQLETTPADLQLVLLELRQYGKPHVGMFHSGWHSSVEMSTWAAGSSFTVRSDFGMDTPMAAALQCLERARKAVT